MADQRDPVLRVVGDGGRLSALAGVSVVTLERVLEHLQKNDGLFDYNVPKKWRDPAKEGLQEFLIRTYLPENFEITDEDAVKKYVRPYDFVGINDDEPVSGYEYYLKIGMKGVIKKVDLEKKYPLTVLWEACDEFREEQTRFHNGGDLLLLPKGIFRREKIGSMVELLAEAAPGMLVEPKEVQYKYKFYVPLCARGVVTKIDRSAEFPVSVVFGNTEGYIPPENGVINCAYNLLKVFRENKFDIRELMKKQDS